MRALAFIVVFVEFIVFSSGSVNAQRLAASNNLPNFHKVNDRIYRGGQPKDAGFDELKRLGIVTVINLRRADERAIREKALVELAGMRYVNIPLEGWDRPEVSTIDEIIRQIKSPENQPVFVHCRRGKDRTGLVFAIYRMVEDKWTVKQAFGEARGYGFGLWHFKLRDFIFDYYRDRIQTKTTPQ